MKSKTRITWLRLQSIVLFSLLLAATSPALAQTQEPRENIIDSDEDGLHMSAESRHGDLVSIISPKVRSSLETAPVDLTVRLGKGVHPANFSAHLNGQEITGKFKSKSACFISKCDLTASAIPDDGLIKGRNELRVEVNGREIGREHASRAFFITGPKANAGSDMRQKIGRRVQLDGSQSSSGSGLSLTRKWTLISQPADSQALLSDSSSARPSFVPDVNGSYTVQVVVNDGYFDSEPETVDISAIPASTLVPVETFHYEGSRYGILVDGKFYSDSDNLMDYGVQILVLDRRTLEPDKFHVFQGGTDPASDITKFLHHHAPNNTKLIIISTGNKGTGFDTRGIAHTLKEFGGTIEFDNIRGDLAYSFIGIRGLHQGQAYQIGGVNPSLSGYFVPDSSRNYTFIQPDYVKYEIKTSFSPTTATITVGDQTFNSGPLENGANGGFFVVVLNRQTLSQVDARLYGTNGGSAQDTDQKAMIHVLRQYAGREGYLVFIASLGHPLSRKTMWIQDIAQVIGQTSANGRPDLSGSYATFAQLGNDPHIPPIGPFTYAFLGSGSPDPALHLPRFNSQEHLSLDASQDVKIRGVLARGRRGAWYAPLNGETTELANLDFYSILAQKPVSWPHPDRDGEKNAYIFISRYVTQTLGEKETINDVRQNYSNGNATNWLVLLLDLGNPPKARPDPDIGTFTPDEYSNVYYQLKTEFPYLSKIQTFNGQLSRLLSDTTLTKDSIRAKVYDRVKESIKINDKSPISLLIDNLFSFLLGAGSSIGGDGVRPLFGVISSMFSFCTELANKRDGNTTSRLDIEAQQLSAALADNFAEQKTSLGTMFDSIYEDWGKFSALAPLLADKQNHPEWYWDQATTEGQIIKALSTSIEASFYQILLPTKLGVVEMFNVSTPGKWCSEQAFTICNYPYHNWPEEGWLATIGPDPYHMSVRFLAGNLGDGKQPDGKPDRSVLDYLYGKVSDGGLGFSKIDLLYRWPLKFGTCDPTHTKDGKCRWVR